MPHHYGGSHRLFAMVTMTVLIIRMRSVVGVQTISSNALVTSLMMVVHGGGDAYVNRGCAMGRTTVATIQTRPDVSVQVISSNVIVTSLRMAAHGGGWDAYGDGGYAMGSTTVVIGRMKSFV